MEFRRLLPTLFLLATGAGVSLYFVLDRHRASSPFPPMSATSASAAHEQDAVNTQAQLDELQHRMLALQEELLVLRSAPQTPTEHPALMAESANRPDESGEIADYDPALAAIKDEQLVSQLDAALAASVDSTPWSVTTEQTIADILVSESIPGTSLVHIQCGENFCRVLLAHDDTRTQLEAAQVIPFTPPFNTDGFIEFTGHEAAPQTLVYIARDGTRLSDISP